MSVIALDPGNSTGWVYRGPEGLLGGTIGEDHFKVFELLSALKPDVVVYETFQMYPGKAQKLFWNTFYPCEVIGIIKLYVQKMNHILDEHCQPTNYRVALIGLQPSVKKYALSPLEGNLWKSVDMYVDGDKPTEHLRDAVRLLRYFERNQESLLRGQ